MNVPSAAQADTEPNNYHVGKVVALAIVAALG